MKSPEKTDRKFRISHFRCSLLALVTCHVRKSMNLSKNCMRVFPHNDEDDDDDTTERSLYEDYYYYECGR